MKKIRLLILIGALTFYACNSKISNNKIAKCSRIDNFYFKQTQFAFFKAKLFEYLKFDRQCENVNIFYKKLSTSTKKIYNNSLFEFINYYTKEFNDSSFINKQYHFHNFEFCCEYKEKNSCVFYTEGIYFSDDFKTIYIRLFQEDNYDNYDFLINIEDEKKYL